MMTLTPTLHNTSVKIDLGPLQLLGDLQIPDGATDLVLFAHGSGSSRHSPRNQAVARTLNEAGLATLLFDLLTAEEEAVDMITRKIRFDIDLLARRLVATTDWVTAQPQMQALSIGYFGSSTGAAAALIAAAERPNIAKAVVSRGGRPDLAMHKLALVQAPTLLIVGGHDYPVITMNEAALARLTGVAKLEIVPGATHLFEETGALDRVAELAAAWFVQYL